MTTTIKRRSSKPKSAYQSETKDVFSDPRRSEDGFSIDEAVREIENAVTDASTFYARMERNEQTRRCEWEGKNGTGLKKDTKKKKAFPFNNAADHEVHLAQEVLLQLTAQRTAAMLRGSLNVTPMNGTKDRAATQMKQVMRYQLETNMGGERIIQGARWASWALRYGHAVLGIGWKTTKAMEKREVTESQLIEARIAADILERKQAGQTVELVNGEELRAAAEVWVREGASDSEVAELLIATQPELAARERAAKSEALKCVKQLRTAKPEEGEEREGYFYTAFVKEDRPVWEALRQGVDFFCPPETMHSPTFDGARWLARVRWVSAAQLIEAANLHEWDRGWTNKVIANCKGKAKIFSTRTSASPWALSGLGVGWTSADRLPINAERHLYQLVEYYDRRVTADGVECLYKTVLHPDINDKVAKRELMPDWHGHYPFVPATNEMDEPLLLANRGVPELVFGAQNAIKAQWDSRTDAASLATRPPMMGPEGMEAIASNIMPGGFVPSWNKDAVSVMKLPPPDGRSIEIEDTIRASINRYFGLMSKDVPQPLAMLMEQTGVDWFLTAYSRAVALTAQLVQQRMKPLVKARITGTSIEVSATREDVRGNYDFGVSFDVRALDIEWTKQILEFVTQTILPMDNRAIIDRRVFIELGLNMIDPSVTDRAVRSDDDARQSEIDDMQAILSRIFSGGVPDFVMGVDYKTRAEEMQRDLQSSPVRQQLMASNEMIAAVWENYYQKLIAQQMQEGDNKQAGIEGGGDPLKQSPMAKFKAGGWQSVVMQQPDAA